MPENKELICRALLGDQEAQKECTEKGILIPCPWCKGEMQICHGDTYGYYKTKCIRCGAESPEKPSEWEAISRNNTRPAPSIGKCGECKYSREPTKQDYEKLDRYSLLHKDACVCAYDDPKEVWKFDFCSSFKPKEK